ncbi:hypothetical protein BZG11_15150 [Salinivibrio kushneri]|uniref:S1 family peptidase n=1 Tax=Salinivibrio kushneri TaxID=1908198 RepID=UPI0009894DBB|nr:serine protease [Salinivibrio kushneri]OOE48174.1 hypothetical protein BZG11_15150 [Salinivibrio kushneri]
MSLTRPVLWKNLGMAFGIVILAFQLGGCTVSNGEHHVVKEHPPVEMIKPNSLLQRGKFGTSVPITPTLSLTAAHVAEFSASDVVAIHPRCDVALIKADNRGLQLPDLGLIYQGDTVEVFGKSSAGDVLSAKGLYYMDLMIAGFKEVENCPSSITDAPIRGGMSGGGAFNRSGELVGILVGFAHPEKTTLDSGQRLGLERMTIFVSINYIHAWLETKAARYGGLSPLSLPIVQDISKNDRGLESSVLSFHHPSR